MKQIILLLLISITAHAQQTITQNWEVSGIQRQAMIYIPATAKTELTPVIFVFHGHGENMQEMFDRHHFEKLWPEAIVIAPQGLNTPGKLVDRAGKKAGWQEGPGNMDDRDIHFFDTILHAITHDYKIDNDRIYCTGHSNGGEFVYLLWAMRGDIFAAVAPSAAVDFGVKDMLKPKPVMHIMGLFDPLVKPAWQKMNCSNLMQLNKCTGQEIHVSSLATLYPSSLKTPVIVFAHPGGHVYPPEASVAAVEFFKRVKRKG